MESRFYHDTGIVHGTADADRTAGEMIKLVDGRAGQVMCDTKNGDPIAYRTSGLIWLAAPTGTTFAAGADVFWDASANTSIAAAGEGADFWCGKAQLAKVSGPLEVLVDLNAVPYHTPE